MALLFSVLGEARLGHGGILFLCDNFSENYFYIVVERTVMWVANLRFYAVLQCQ